MWVLQQVTFGLMTMILDSSQPFSLSLPLSLSLSLSLLFFSLKLPQVWLTNIRLQPLSFHGGISCLSLISQILKQWTLPTQTCTPGLSAPSAAVGLVAFPLTARCPSLGPSQVIENREREEWFKKKRKQIVCVCVCVCVCGRLLDFTLAFGKNRDPREPPFHS